MGKTKLVVSEHPIEERSVRGIQGVIAEGVLTTTFDIYSQRSALDLYRLWRPISNY